MQEKKLRDAAKDLFDAVHDWHWGEPSDRAEFGDGDTWERAADSIRASMEQALRVLASTTGETEMEKLRRLLEAAQEEEEGDSAVQYGITIALNIITTQFGEGEGDADRERD